MSPVREDKLAIWEFSSRIPGELFMFTSLFSHKRTGRAVSAFLVLLGAAFVFSTLSCRQPTDDTTTGGSIYGTWSSTSDGYTVTTSTVTYDDRSGYGYGWTGSLEGVSETDSASGYLYVKYTSVGSSMSPSLVNSFIAVSYKSLGASSVQMATAYKSDGTASESTLDAAKSKYTIDNGYYSYYGSYTK
jgi:hypothetical protein